MRVAIVHDYLNQAGGAERVVASFHRMFPEAPIYTSIVTRDRLWPELREADIRTSWMQRLPGIHRHFKKYFMLYPFVFEGLDLSEYDLVISSSSAYAKAIKVRSDALHVCYCYTPMRFVWDYKNYVERERMSGIIRSILPFFIRALKKWDIRTANRPHHYVAISNIVAQRIQHSYDRPSEIVFPPVDLSKYRPQDRDDDFYLVVSRLNPYKRIDLAVRAFNELGLPLLIVGDGPDREALEKMAKPNVKFLGRRSDAETADLYARCKALIFPGVEDFGITPLEANASGRPVIAYADGGALDTTIPLKTGIFFQEKTPDSLKQAVLDSQAISWNKEELRRNAERFGEDAFAANFKRLLSSLLGRTKQEVSQVGPQSSADVRSG